MKFLAGDIGGTKTFLSVYEMQGEAVHEIRRKKYPSKDAKQFEELLAAFLREEPGEKISAACLGVAGPVENEKAKVTNLGWVIDRKTISKRFSIPHVYLLNDVQASAYGIETLKEKDLHIINRGERVEKANRALISAGTGLGEALLLFDGKRWISSGSEGGHSDFSPRNEIEIELLRYLWKRFNHASYERVLSGSGLVTLYQFLIDCGIEKENEKTKIKMKGEDPAKVIVEHASTNSCLVCKHALSWFCSIYGAEAGNFALKVLAQGGLFIGGGIAPKIIFELEQEEFMKAFVDKGRFSPLLSKIPVKVILEEESGLKGVAHFCKNKLEKK